MKIVQRIRDERNSRSKGRIAMGECGTWQMYVEGFGKGFLKGAVLGVLFYRHLLAVLLVGGLAGIFGARGERGRIWKGRQQEITLQFREGLQGIAASLSAGYSIENAIGEARKDLVLLYGEHSVLEQEFLGMERQLGLNQPMEQVLCEFAEKWDTDDFRHFAQVFQTAKRTGGNLIAITHATAEKISQKIEVQREIHAMLAGKKMEGQIMSAIPLGLIVFFWVSSPGFLDCFYRSSGRAVSTALLLIYVAASQWSRKICDIRV